jgi:amidohydrolase
MGKPGARSRAVASRAAPSRPATTKSPTSSVPPLVDLRRELHSIAELSLRETQTSALLEGWLGALGLAPRRIAGTGLTALVAGAAPGRTILARADIDGLPIVEDTELAFASRHAGAMHACGHDCHAAALVEAARRLAARAPSRGTAKLLFQPGEEGANGMGLCIDDGLLERPKVDAAVGVHVWQAERVGRIGLVKGPCMASVDDFEVTLVGRGGHAAYPHKSVDPVVVAAHVVTALQTLVARRVSPFDTAVVTVGSLHAGTAFNVIPPAATLKGTVRTFQPAVRRAIAAEFRRVVANVAKGLGARAEIQYRFFLPATVNDSAMVDLAWSVAEGIVGKRNVVASEPSMGGEDMSLALAAVPGVFAFVGGADGGRSTSYPHHHPKFDVNEDCLAVAAGFMEGFVRRYLDEAA